MFGGTFKHNLDSAGRFVMPLDIRLDLGSAPVYIAKGVGCLCVFTEAYAKSLEDEFNKLGSPLSRILNPDIAKLHRHLFSGMVRTAIDKQNRTPLTTEHRRYAGINEDVVICGCGSYVELWSPEAHEKYIEQNENIDSLIASGAQLLGSAARVSGDVNAGLSQTGTA